LKKDKKGFFLSAIAFKHSGWSRKYQNNYTKLVYSEPCRLIESVRKVSLLPDLQPFNATETAMKTGSKIAIFLLVAVALAHLLRLVFNINVSVDDWQFPQWISVLGVVVPGLVAWMLWRESN
jgi:hypothetical protein